MLERNNKSGVSRINKYRDKTGGRQIKCENRYNAYDKEAATKKNAQIVDARIEFEDKRYEALTKIFMNTIHARNLDVFDTGFDEIMEEILQTIYQSKLFEVRYKNDDKTRVKNAILRAVNKERNKKKTEKGRDDE